MRNIVSHWIVEHRLFLLFLLLDDKHISNVIELCFRYYSLFHKQIYKYLEAVLVYY